MKHILLFLMGWVMFIPSLAQVKQVSNTIKACTYFDFLIPSPYSATPTRAEQMLEISYSSKNKRFGLDYKLGDKRVMISCSYENQLSDGRYRYTGFEINSMQETQVITNEKLSKFLEYYGQEQLQTFEYDKRICIEMAYSGSLYIYPLKNTPKLQAAIEEQIKEQEKYQLAKKTYEKLCSTIIKENFNDSIKTFMVNRILNNESLYKKLKSEELSKKIDCIGCVDSTGIIRIVEIEGFLSDDVLLNEYSSKDGVTYTTEEGGKLYNSKAFFKATFNLKSLNFKTVDYGTIIIAGKERTVRRDRLKYDNISTEVLDVIDSKRLKRGKYDLYFEIIDNKPILVKSRKRINPVVQSVCAISLVLLPVAFVEYKEKELYYCY